MTAIRIQRQRTKGWHAPEGAIYVGRGSMWGNPFIVGEPSGVFPASMGRHGQEETLIEALTLEDVVSFYRRMIQGFLSPEMYPAGHDWRAKFHARYKGHPEETARSSLRGRPLICWCAIISQDTYCPCHADVLLSIANDITMEEVIRENTRRAKGKAVR